MSPIALCVFALLAASCSAGQISPKSYDLELLLDTDLDVFSGKVTIDAKVTSPGATYFVLHNNGLNISTVAVTQQGGENFFLSKATNSEDQSTMITLNRGLTQTQDVKIVIDYQGRVSTKEMTGLFSFQDSGKKFYMTNFYPIYARKVFPCFDVPSEAAPITLSIIVTKENGQLIGTGWNVEKTQLPNGYVQYKLGTTIAIAPYSLFFTMGDWSSDSYYVAAPRSNVWLPPSLKKQVANIDPNLAAVMRSSNASNLVSNYLDHINIFVAPQFEDETYSGLNTVVLRQDIVIQNARETTTDIVKANLVKMTYAVMRMFYGTMVRPADWGNNWLATSLPGFLAYQVLDEPQFTQTYGDSNENLVSGLYERVFESSSSKDSPPVYSQSAPTKPNDILSVVKNSGVEKGIYVLKTLESFVNSSTKTPSAAQLRNTLYSFLLTMNGSAVDTNAFVDFIDQTIRPQIIAGKLSDVMLPILSQGGYPLVKLDRISHSLDMLKESFVKLHKSPSKYPAVTQLADVESWSFPVTVTTSQNPNPDNATVYFFSANSNSQSIQGYYPDDGWALLNVDGKDMMRVSYDLVSWSLLSAKANKTFSPATRAKLVADAFAAAESKVQSWVWSLQYLEALDHETHLAPWKVGLEGFARMWSWIYHTGTSQNNNSSGQINLVEPFKTYVRARLNNIYQRLGPIGSNDDPMDPVRREVVAAMCEYGDDSCVSNLTAQYNQMTWNKLYPSNNMLSVVVCNGLRGSKIDNYKKEYNNYIYSGMWYSQPLRNSHYSFLACPDSDSNGHSDAVDYFLTNVLLDTTFPQDQIVPAATEILMKPQHVDQVVSFFVDKQPSFNLSTAIQVDIVTEMGKRLTSPTQTAMLSKFLDDHKNLTKELSSAITQAINMGTATAQYIVQIQNDVLAALNGANPTPATPTGGSDATPATATSGPTGPVTDSTATPPPSTTPGAASTAAASLSALLAALAFAFASQ